jgi:hypothetical protein
MPVQPAATTVRYVLYIADTVKEIDGYAGREGGLKIHKKNSRTEKAGN